MHDCDLLFVCDLVINSYCMFVYFEFVELQVVFSAPYKRVDDLLFMYEPPKKKY